MSTSEMAVEILRTPELGDRSYLIHDGERAVVVDSQRDTDRMVQLADRAGVDISLVLETHIHNDYVTGGYQLATETGARYGINAADPVHFDREGLSVHDVLRAGSLDVHVIATPGHTDTHLAYAVVDRTEPATPALFTGGSLLYGSVGRTDLVDAARTTELTRAQFRSARHLATFPHLTPVYPTHGFGSFCAVGAATGGESSTIGTEIGRNDALTTSDEDAFVARLVASLSDYPSYYAHMAPLNLAGPSAPDLAPPIDIDADELGARIAAGEWIIDLRERAAYARDHLRGTVCIPLGNQFSTYLGWLVPWDAPITLIGESGENVAAAQRQLARIGIERLAGASTARLDTLASVPRSGYAQLRFDQLPMQLPAGEVLLDVRRTDERSHGYVPGSIHIPLPELARRAHELPEGRIWVHCASGYRAAIAASVVERSGRDVVYIDDDFDNASRAGHLVRAAAAA